MEKDKLSILKDVNQSTMIEGYQKYWLHPEFAEILIALDRERWLELIEMLSVVKGVTSVEVIVQQKELFT